MEYNVNFCKIQGDYGFTQPLDRSQKHAADRRTDLTV
jgi:hypothetical protein